MHLSTSPAARVGLTTWLTAALLFSLVPIAGRMGYRINRTPSVPLGIWRILPLDTLERGQIVSVCPPPDALFLDAQARGYLAKGRCPGELEPMLKPVAGLPGDSVQQTPQGLLVNGQLLSNSIALSSDSQGRPLKPSLPGESFTIDQDQILLVSGVSPRSFDSRYFGTLPLASIEGRAVPVWTVAP
jgi:conjugative transfer signal peptidase TraF